MPVRIARTRGRRAPCSSPAKQPMTRAAEHPAGGPGDDQHGERAEQCGGEAPAQRRVAVRVAGAVDVAEHPLGDGHQPLAERRVDGETRPDAVIAALDAELQQSCASRVIDLVEGVLGLPFTNAGGSVILSKRRTPASSVIASGQSQPNSRSCSGGGRRASLVRRGWEEPAAGRSVAVTADSVRLRPVEDRDHRRFAALRVADRQRRGREPAAARDARRRRHGRRRGHPAPAPARL